MNLHEIFEEAYAINPINAKNSTKHEAEIEFNAVVSRDKIDPIILRDKYRLKISDLKAKNYNNDSSGTKYQNKLPSLEDWLLKKGWEEDIESIQGDNGLDDYLYGWLKKTHEK